MQPDEIPLESYRLKDDLPYVYPGWQGTPTDDFYTERGGYHVRWPEGQRVRVMFPSQCTRCGQAGNPSPKLIGYVAELNHRENGGHGPTQWVTYCVEHYDRAHDAGCAPTSEPTTP